MPVAYCPYNQISITLFKNHFLFLHNLGQKPSFAIQKTRQKETCRSGLPYYPDGQTYSVLFLVESILLVDLVIRRLNHVLHIESAARNLI